MVSRNRLLALLLAVGLAGPLATGGAAFAAPEGPDPLAPVEAPPETVSARLPGLASAYGAAGEPVPGADPGATVSAPTEAPIPFAMVGLELPAGAEASIRTSLDGRSWSEWSPAPTLEPDDGPDQGSAEATVEVTRFTDVVWVGESRWLQVSLEGAAPAEVGATFIDSIGLGTAGAPADAAGQAAPAASDPGYGAASTRPAIVTRAQWGANEAATTSAGSAPAVRFAVVHHTAGSNSYTAAQAPGVVRGIHAYHTGTLGWSDIGYNFLVDRYGTVYEGRRGSLDRAVIGAHAQGFNTGSVGISILGNFESVAAPQVALDAVARVLAWKLAIDRVDPTGTVVVTSAGSNKYASGTRVTLPTIIGHRDVGLTACPGLPVQNKLPALRLQVASLIGIFSEATPPSATPPPSGPGGYWMLGADGVVHPFGPAPHCGNLRLGTGAAGTDIEPFPNGRGYWLLDGRRSVVAVSCDGTAPPVGYEPGRSFSEKLVGAERPVSLSSVPDGSGYWVFTDRGRALAFGSARSYGDMGGKHLNAAILDSVATRSGKGYWMVAADGGIFSFGDAGFAGSMGGKRLNRPVMSMAPDPDGRGYWLVASDGGVFSFDAPFHGSMATVPLNRPVSGMVTSPTGAGYLMVGEDGGAFTFGDVAFHGSLADRRLATPIVAIAARR